MPSQLPVYFDRFSCAGESDYYPGGCTGVGASHFATRCHAPLQTDCTPPEGRLRQVPKTVASPFGGREGDTNLTLSLWQFPDKIAVARQDIFSHICEKSIIYSPVSKTLINIGLR